MNNKIITIVLIALIVVVAYFYGSSGQPKGVGTATTTPSTGTSVNKTVTTPEGVTFSYPSNTYGLATTPNQILVLASIRPCDENFNYCLYRSADDLSGTNFESAGLRIQHRSDLVTQQSCLNTLPTGYTGITATVSQQSNYATSAFPVSDAAAGHYSSGALYRLYSSGTCTEFETRIGASQFANYPAGSIQPFSDAERAQVQTELASLLGSVSVSGRSIIFPRPTP